MEQYGITGYEFTIDGMQRTLTDSDTIVFSSLAPSTQYTVEYNASTECGDMFVTSTTVTTLADWSRVENYTFSSDGQVFNYTITDRTLCLDTLSNCMDNMTSNCGLTLAQVNGNTLTYDVTLSTSICTVSVFPVGRICLITVVLKDFPVHSRIRLLSTRTQLLPILFHLPSLLCLLANTSKDWFAY